MIELTFITAGELVKFKIDEKKIWFCGKPTNFAFVPWNPIMSATNVAKQRARKGEEWYNYYITAEETFRDMKNDKEVADDIVRDFQKRGLRLAKRIESPIPNPKDELGDKK